MTRPTVYLVDDDEATRRSLSWYLSGAGWDVIAFASAKEFLPIYDVEREACLVLDLRMPEMNGLELVTELHAKFGVVAALMISSHPTLDIAMQAARMGVLDFLEKPFTVEVLLERLWSLWDKERQLHTRRLFLRETANNFSRLTPREREVLNLVLEGKPNKQIAAILGISVKAIESHRARIMEKMAAESLPELVNAMTLYREWRSSLPAQK